MTQESLLRQAWLNAQNLFSDSDTEKQRDRLNTNTMDVDSEAENRNVVSKGKKRQKSSKGLPMPKIYKKTPSKRSKTRRKQKLVAKERELMQDTSDEEVDFIASIEKDVPTIKSEIEDKENESVSTSTPFKSKVFSSPQLPSPIRGLTPLRNSNILDNSLLDCLKDSDNESMKNIFGSPDLLFKKFSPCHMRSPNMSQVEMLFSGLTPVKGESENENNHNLSQILAEFEEEEGLPANLSNISWGTLCQNINGESDNG